MGRKVGEVKSDIHIRVLKTKTLESLKKVKELRKGTDEQINVIVNDALEIALPIMLDKGEPETIKKIISENTETILKKQAENTKKLFSEIRKISILLLTNEQLVGTILQEFEYFLSVKNIEIPQELLLEFKDNLPKRFEDEKKKLIEDLIKKLEV